MRLRSPLLANAVFAERLTSALLKIDGVWKAQVNPRTDGLLLEYDKKRLPLSVLKEAAPLLNCLGRLEELSPAEHLSILERALETLSEKLESWRNREY